MNAIRSVITAFLLTVLILSFLGWRWAARLPSPKQEGARLVLALSAVSALVGIGSIWTIRSGKAR